MTSMQSILVILAVFFIISLPLYSWRLKKELKARGFGCIPGEKEADYLAAYLVYTAIVLFVRWRIGIEPGEGYFLVGIITVVSIPLGPLMGIVLAGRLLYLVFHRDKRFILHVIGLFGIAFLIPYTFCILESAKADEYNIKGRWVAERLFFHHLPTDSGKNMGYY